MIKSLTLFSLLFISFNIYSQKFDVADSIAVQTCTCSEEAWKAGMSQEESSTSLGLCMLSAAMPYQEELKKQYKIKLPKKASKLGEIVGVKMVTTCPDYMFHIIGETTEEVYLESREKRGIQEK